MSSKPSLTQRSVVQVLFAGDSFAVVEGLDQNAPSGALVIFAGGAKGCVLPQFNECQFLMSAQ